MAFNFKYKSSRLKSGDIIYRPMIPLTLESHERIDVIAILDSGSDMTIIPKELAEAIGVKYTGENEISGIAGIPVKSKEGKVKIIFGKGHEVYSFDVPILVPEKEDIQIIIGRAGFFNEFKITFDESARKIEFKKVSKGSVIY
ncbi:retropepsin-like domain-containing protein [Candidatus Pacearchaeota archaeon]|nr:retropepsin-like domain-containing protein [Candidatus Pacearchaeota archaeon]